MVAKYNAEARRRRHNPKLELLLLKVVPERFINSESQLMVTWMGFGAAALKVLGVHIVKSVLTLAHTLALATTRSVYPASCFSGRAGFSDLDPPDGGWSQNPAGTV